MESENGKGFGGKRRPRLLMVFLWGRRHSAQNPRNSKKHKIYDYTLLIRTSDPGMISLQISIAIIPLLCGLGDPPAFSHSFRGGATFMMSPAGMKRLDNLSGQPLTHSASDIMDGVGDSLCTPVL